MATTKNKDENKDDLEELKGYEYPFTNLVMEGGGSKGMAYVGALKVFEELGILSKITRICGASAGAIAGTLLAVGFSLKELEKLLGENLEEILLGGNKSFINVNAQGKPFGEVCALVSAILGQGGKVRKCHSSLRQIKKKYQEVVFGFDKDSNDLT